MHAVSGTDYANVWLSNGDGTFNVKSFRPWPGYAIPNGVWLMADVNGDGKADIVHAVAGTDYVNIWLSNGDGTFTVKSFQPWPGYAIPNGVWLAADVNGDGKVDIVHAVAGTDYVNVWLSNGDGTFNVKQFRPWAGYEIPNGVWLVADVNGDGKADIVHAVAGTDYANVWLSNGDGTFNVKPFSPWPGYSIPNGVWLAADINGDGKTDIFHAVAGSDYANVWLSNGDGTFTVKSFRPWAGYSIPNGVWLATDLNNDGRTDIVHAVDGADYANVWLSNGDGTFSVTSFSPWPGYSIVNGIWLAGDFTGDGNGDIVHAVASGDYIHPWTSLFPNRRQVSLAGLEIVQAIQDMNETVALVAGKQTWARAYLTVPEQAPTTVRGQLQVRDLATGNVTNVTAVGTASLNPGDLQQERQNLPLSLNFVLPAAAISAGQRQITLVSVTTPDGSTVLSCPNCAASARTVTFVDSAPLRVRMVGINYTTGTPPATTLNSPSSADFTLLQSWLGRAYPVAQVIASQTTVASSNTWPFTCNQANAQLQSLRATEVSGGVDTRTHYYGLVSNGGGYMRGCASVPPSADPTAVGSGPTGNPAGPGSVPVNVTGDTDASFGDWYGGHEIGHTFGRSHPGFCNGNSADDPSFPNPNGQISDNIGAFDGLDVGDPGNGISAAALPGPTRFDIMTYCNQPQWLSSYTYEGIRTRLNAEDPSGGGAPGGGPGARSGGVNAKRSRVTTPSGISFRAGCYCPDVKAARSTAPPVIQVASDLRTEFSSG